MLCRGCDPSDERDAGTLGDEFRADELQQSANPIPAVVAGLVKMRAWSAVPVAASPTVGDTGIGGSYKHVRDWGVRRNLGPPQPRHDRDPGLSPVRATLCPSRKFL